MELTQILLFIVVGVLTTLLVAVGIQVMIILFQAHRAVKKIDKIIEDANVISSSVARPVAGVSNFLEGLKNMKSIVEIATGKQVKQVKDPSHGSAPMQAIHSMVNSSPVAPIVEELIEDVSAIPQQIHQHTHIKELQERGRRFFHKGGKPLSS